MGSWQSNFQNQIGREKQLLETACVTFLLTWCLFKKKLVDLKHKLIITSGRRKFFMRRVF